MFHNIMPTNDLNNQIYVSYNDLEMCGFGVDVIASGTDQDIFQADLNSSKLISDFQAFPPQETVEPWSLTNSITGDISTGLCDFTLYQPSSGLTSTSEDNTASSIVPGSSPVLANSWEINNYSQCQTTFVNGRKRSECEPEFSYGTAYSVPRCSENTPPRVESTGSKSKRRRVQNARQRKEANVRERKRMVNLNEAFDSLKSRVPTFSNEKRLSRMETLRLAIDYISFMKDVLADKDTSNNIGNCQDSQSDLDSIDISFTLEDLEALQKTNTLYSLDYTDSSDSDIPSS